MVVDMSGPRLTFQLEGSDEDRGDVRLSDFVKQLDSIQHALKETDRVLHEAPTAYFTIVDLSHRSPATVVIEEVPISANRTTGVSILSIFFASLLQIERGEMPPQFDYDALQAYKGMTTLVGKRVKRVQVRRDDQSVALTPDLGLRVDQILGPDDVEYGSVSGRLEQINLHAQRVFTIYPTAGLPKLRCVFPPELRAAAVGAVDRYVRVYGRLKFKRRLDRSHPYEMVVERLEVAPPEDELPTLGSLRGIASDVELNEPSEAALRRIRDEW